MKRRQALLATGAAGLLLAAGLAGATSPASAASSGCSVSYTVQSEWSGGFTAAVNVTNLGSAITSWTLTFDFPDTAQKVIQGWSATWSQSATHVTAASMSWNGALGANASTTIGFVGAASGTNPVPTSFALNGTACTGAVTTPSVTPTTQTPTPTITTASPTPTVTTASPTPSGPAPALHVSGKHLVTAAGSVYRLLGVNRSSGEFACVQGKGMWDSDPVNQASVDAMKTWNIHAVRIPLNEECWLGLNGTPSGTTYQQNVKDYVNLLVSNGITPIVEMHWSRGVYTGQATACSDVAATCQKPMPDAEYAPTFWTQVATAFKNTPAVVFDLFNEPYPDAAANWDATAAWTCWRDGGTCTGITYQVAGMQSLLNAVRATGATNVVMLSGMTWANDLTQWLSHKPTDPTGNLMASWHSYNFNACVTSSCWDSQIGAVAAQVPVVAGEIGQNTCAHDYIDQVMNWADANGVGYLAWTWNAWGVCGSSGNVLITDQNGTPTSTYGEGFKAHLLTQNP